MNTPETPCTTGLRMSGRVQGVSGVLMRIADVPCRSGAVVFAVFIF